MGTERGYRRISLGPSSVGYVLFFLMLFVPTTYQTLKSVLLAVVITSIVLTMLLTGEVRLHPPVVLLTLFFSGLGAFFVWWGIANGWTEGAIGSARVYVAWPLVYLLLIEGASRNGHLTRILRSFVLITLAIEAYSMSYILAATGYLPAPLYIELTQGQEISWSPTYKAYNLYSISSLLFLIPFLLALLVAFPKRAPLPTRRAWIWIATMMGFGLVILSVRTGLIMAVGLALPIALFFRALYRHSKPTHRFRTSAALFGLMTAGAAMVVLLTSLLDVNLPSAVAVFTSDFDFGGGGESPLVRRDQFLALLAGWRHSPLLGVGLGGIADVVRSQEMPWGYELSYASLLFHVGLVGVVAYAFGMGWIFREGVRVLRSGSTLAPYMIPVLTGTACFLIGNATNPYLEKFDYLWVVFLPVALINRWHLENREQPGGGASGLVPAPAALISPRSSEP